LAMRVYVLPQRGGNPDPVAGAQGRALARGFPENPSPIKTGGDIFFHAYSSGAKCIYHSGYALINGSLNIINQVHHYQTDAPRQPDLVSKERLFPGTTCFPLLS